MANPVPRLPSITRVTTDSSPTTATHEWFARSQLTRASPLSEHPAFAQKEARTTSNATSITQTQEVVVEAQEAGKEDFADVDLGRTRTERPAHLKLWTVRTVLMAVLVSLGGLIFGYGGIGQIGGFLAMQNYRDSFGDVTKDGKGQLSDTRQGTIVGMLMIGALVGSLIAGKIADKIGRKKSISIWSGVYLVGQIVEISSVSAWYQIVIGRTISGLGIGGLSILVPMYQGETAPKEARGVIISMYQLFITLGILLASLMNLGTKDISTSASWRITIGCGTLWPLILGIGILFLDESPRWDLRRDSVDSAIITVANIYNTDKDNEYVRQEVSEMQENVRREVAETKTFSFASLWREPTIARRFAVGMMLQAMQQLTGVNYFFYFGTELFAHLDVGDSYITAVILGSVNFVATFAGLWVAKRFGHRIALTLGGFWIGMSLLLYAFFGTYCIEQDCGMKQSSIGAAMVAFTCMAIIGFATTWGPLAWVVCAEIFPARWRAAGMGAATATNWTFNFLIAFFTTKITRAIGFKLGFVFGACIITGAWFVHFFVHETAGKSLEEIDAEILGGGRALDSKKGS